MIKKKVGQRRVTITLKIKISQPQLLLLINYSTWLKWGLYVLTAEFNKIDFMLQFSLTVLMFHKVAQIFTEKMEKMSVFRT